MEMRKRDLVFGISAGIALGTVVTIGLVMIATVGFELYEENSAEKKMKERIAAEAGSIDPDLSRYFNVSVAKWEGQVVFFEDCRIVGVADSDPNADGAIAGLVSGDLVLETRDRRRIYVDRANILSLEEVDTGDV